MLRMSTFWRRIRYSSRSSGPSKASRKISSACGGMYRSRGNCVMGSPLTTAKGISTCSGASSGAGGGGLDTTILRSGFIIVPNSLSLKVHRTPNLIERGARDLPCLLAALMNQIRHELGDFLELLRALAHALDLFDDALD